MNYLLHPEAEEEFSRAVDYYEECSPGLGEDFALEVYATISNILAFPDAWPMIDNPVRRCLTHRFPYGVLYSVDDQHIYILAISNLHRHPDYWKQRRL